MMKSSEIRDRIESLRKFDFSQSIAVVAGFFIPLVILAALVESFSQAVDQGALATSKFLAIGFASFLPLLIYLRLNYLKVKKHFLYCPKCKALINGLTMKQVLVSLKCQKCFKIIVEDDINNQSIN